MLCAYSYVTRQAHQRLSEQVEQFLSHGGCIEEVPPGASGFVDGVPKALWKPGYTAKASKNDAHQR